MIGVAILSNSLLSSSLAARPFRYWFVDVNGPMSRDMSCKRSLFKQAYLEDRPVNACASLPDRDEEPQARRMTRLG